MRAVLACVGLTAVAALAPLILGCNGATVEPVNLPSHVVPASTVAVQQATPRALPPLAHTLRLRFTGHLDVTDHEGTRHELPLQTTHDLAFVVVGAKHDELVIDGDGAGAGAGARELAESAEYSDDQAGNDGPNGHNGRTGADESQYVLRLELAKHEVDAVSGLDFSPYQEASRPTRLLLRESGRLDIFDVESGDLLEDAESPLLAEFLDAFGVPGERPPLVSMFAPLALDQREWMAGESVRVAWTDTVSPDVEGRIIPRRSGLISGRWTYRGQQRLAGLTCALFEAHHKVDFMLGQIGPFAGTLRGWCAVDEATGRVVALRYTGTVDDTFHLDLPEHDVRGRVAASGTFSVELDSAAVDEPAARH